MPRYGRGYTLEPATVWSSLPITKRLWFSRHLSTGAGPDEWLRAKKNIFQKELDAWWGGELGDYRNINSPVYKHDWEYFRGFRCERERERADKQFLADTLKMTPWAFIACFAAYKLIRELGVGEMVIVRRDERHLDSLITFNAKFIEYNNRRPSIHELMSSIREEESESHNHD